MNDNRDQSKPPFLGLTPCYYQDERLVYEQIEALGLLTFFYQNPLGKMLRPLITATSLMSKLAGYYQNSRLSKKDITPFIQKHSINIHECEKQLDQYTSFNDFFSRKLKPSTRTIDTRHQIITSPVDGKLFIIPHLDQQTDFFVKNQRFNLERFLKDATLARQYQNGTLMIFRLAPYDYHRFHFPVDCTPSTWQQQGGVYESVNPLVYASGVQPLTENQRHLVQLETEQFGTILMSIVGALLVGRIVETYAPETAYKKGDEMGYFEFGGSTVTLLFKAGTIKPIEKIVQNSLQGVETAVRLGQAITE